MKNLVRMVLAACLAAIACDGGPMAPKPCIELNDITLYTGDQDRIALCYAGIDDLSIEVRSSDPEIVDATYRRDTQEVGLFAHSPGEATVTVTARNDDEASEQMFRVIVPNRPPVLTGEIADKQMPPEAETSAVLKDVFSDPDGLALSYMATSTDPSVATASVRGDSLIVTGVGDGEARVTVTATDGPDEVSASLAVLVKPIETLYSTEFHNISDVNDWWKFNSSVHSFQPGLPGLRVRDGALEFWGTDGWALQYSLYAGLIYNVGWLDIETELRTLDQGTGAAIELYVRDQAYPRVYILFRFFRGMNGTSNEGDVWLLRYKQSEGDYVIEERLDLGGLNADTWYKLRVRYWNGRIEVEVNDGEYAAAFGYDTEGQIVEAILVNALYSSLFGEDRPIIGNPGSGFPHENNRIQVERFTIRGWGRVSQSREREWVGG